MEVFAAYIQQLGQVFPITPGLQELLDAVITAPDWKLKAVGMQVVTEGLALYFFRDMRNQTQEPLLKKLLTYVSRDEARHTGYGIKYLGHVVPSLSPRENRELQDFAFECTRNLMASRAATTMRDRVMRMWSDAGVDPDDVLAALAAERDVIARELARSGGRYGPVSGLTTSTLRALGLYGERRGSVQADVDGDAGPRSCRALRELDGRAARGSPSLGERKLRESLTRAQAPSTARAVRNAHKRAKPARSEPQASEVLEVKVDELSAGSAGGDRERDERSESQAFDEPADGAVAERRP